MSVEIHKRMPKRDTDPVQDCDDFNIDRRERSLAKCDGDGHYLCNLCIHKNQEEQK